MGLEAKSLHSKVLGEPPACHRQQCAGGIFRHRRGAGDGPTSGGGGREPCAGAAEARMSMAVPLAASRNPLAASIRIRYLSNGFYKHSPEDRTAV